MDVRSVVRRDDIYWAVYSNEDSVMGVEGGGGGGGGGGAEGFGEAETNTAASQPQIRGHSCGLLQQHLQPKPPTTQDLILRHNRMMQH